jgi:hypothetical protein
VRYDSYRTCRVQRNRVTMPSAPVPDIANCLLIDSVPEGNGCAVCLETLFGIHLKFRLLARGAKTQDCSGFGHTISHGMLFALDCIEKNWMSLPDG